MAPPSAIEVTAESDTSGITLPNPLVLPIASNEIYGRRKKASNAQWSVAAPSNTDNFRLRSYDHKPKAKRWGHLFTNEAIVRKGNSLKEAAKFLGTPGIISLGGGLPSSEYFPFDELSIKVPRIGHFAESDTHETGVTLTAGKHDLAAGTSTFDIATAFNYGQGAGSAQLLRFITEHTELVHEPPYQDWTCTMSVGSTSALDMTLRMLTRPGDIILSEAYTFSAFVETARPMGVRVAGVPIDAEGLLPEGLDELLSKWDVNARGGKKPNILYTVPTGQNPTGATQSAPRRKALYKIAQKHDLLIIEDEPYYFLQMPPYTPTASSGSTSTPTPTPITHSSFLASLVPSFLRLDTDGRVVRLDSFSKVLSPGTRVGWVTAPFEITSRFAKHADVSTQNPSGVSQLVLYKLLDEHWGHGGYLDWLVHLRTQYTNRRAVILRACEAHLPQDIVSWSPPMAGMFHWLCINYQRHPDFPKKSIEQIEESIFLRVIKHGALVMRGSWFYADPEEAHETLFLRTTFAAAPEERIEEAIRRVGGALREEFGVV